MKDQITTRGWPWVPFWKASYVVHHKSPFHESHNALANSQQPTVKQWRSKGEAMVKVIKHTKRKFEGSIGL